METNPMDSSPATTVRLNGALWIGPACGLVISALVTFVGRTTNFEYRRESSMAAFYIVAVVVGAYCNGSLKTRPVRVVALAILFATIAAVIAHG